MTAPLPRTGAADGNGSMFVVPTPSMSRPATTGALASSRIQGELVSALKLVFLLKAFGFSRDLRSWAPET